jgi:hypothetical protein
MLRKPAAAGKVVEDGAAEAAAAAAVGSRSGLSTHVSAAKLRRHYQQPQVPFHRIRVWASALHAQQTPISVTAAAATHTSCIA